jgi:hypothetical protein
VYLGKDKSNYVYILQVWTAKLTATGSQFSLIIAACYWDNILHKIWMRRWEDDIKVDVTERWCEWVFPVL